jgi:hypothetical protein
MRHVQLVTAAALVIGFVAVVGVTVINAKSARQVATAPASTSVNVMQMMKNARNLPEERFDAH